MHSMIRVMAFCKQTAIYHAAKWFCRAEALHNMRSAPCAIQSPVNSFRIFTADVFFSCRMMCSAMAAAAVVIVAVATVPSDCISSRYDFRNCEIIKWKSCYRWTLPEWELCEVRNIDCIGNVLFIEPRLGAVIFALFLPTSKFRIEAKQL